MRPKTRRLFFRLCHILNVEAKTLSHYLQKLSSAIYTMYEQFKSIDCTLIAKHFR